jgi:hypothetical protein
MFTFTANSRQTLNFTSIERLVQANQGALLGLVAFAEQTGPRPQDFVLSVQGQVAGNVNPVAVAPVAPAANTFIVSPARVNPVALVSAPELAVADVNGDAVPDLIVASGSGSSPLITVVDGTFLFSGVSNLPAQAIIAQFFAYDPNFLGGVFVAAADLNGDGRAEIITGAGAGGGPHVKVFTINPNAPAGSRVQPFPGPLGSFFAYDPNFGGGVRVAAGNVTAAGPPDIVTAAGPGGGPHVKVFDGATGATVRSFFAYDPTFTGGVFVAVSSSVGNSDYDRDGFADILTGPGFGGGPHVKIFSGQNLAVLTSFMAFGQPGGGLFPSTFASGVGGVSFFVDEADDGFADDVLVTTGRTRGALALVFRDKPVGQPLGPTPDKTLVNDPQFIDGLIPGLLTF